MMEKRTTHKAALLSLLSDGAVHHMQECQKAGGWRYGGRIHELRKFGHDIETIFRGRAGRNQRQQEVSGFHAPQAARCTSVGRC